MINQKRTQELEELASQILFNNDMYKIPVNLLKIAKNCGITVYDTDFEKLGNKNVSGAIRYVDNNFSILLNKNEPEERKRFTLAHELGHFFLDNNILKSSKIHIDTLYRACGDSSYIAKKTDEQCQIQLTPEHEIDYFAGALLMNKMMLRKIFEIEQSTKKLAQIFNVSHSAMTVRLDKLGLI
ncbi:MAG: ImmA/IrrE family metallo-endopeptidase [Clostridiales bacterium]|nr:ImmA/IrrE family metallo-endopeptidase [Clostridiales bacterium]